MRKGISNESSRLRISMRPRTVGGGGVVMILHSVVMWHSISHPYKARMDHGEFSPYQAQRRGTEELVTSCVSDAAWR